ncbi:hypothetical protein [Chitinophaga barathri]|nr:hypothetical protein [Chitinophaga barathri]
MKKLILLAAIVLTAATSFGRDISRKVQVAFAQEFAGAANVNWYEVDNNYMAKFTLNARKITAHFDKDGNLIATSRLISDVELPYDVITRLIRKYPDQKINNIVEYVVDGNTFYSIVLEGETHWTTLKSNTSGDIILLKKLQKA